MRPKSLQHAALLRARDFAGGVSHLGRKIGIGADSLDAMLHGTVAIPSWLFLRLVDYLNEVETSGAQPRDFPPDWQDMPDGQRPH